MKGVSLVRRRNGDPGDSPANIVVDVYSAAAYGDLEKLRNFVEAEGHSVSRPDGNGYYALQWAALNNYPYVAWYIIEHGGDVDAADNSQQKALHWAAVRGSVAVADVLLQSGARVEAADLNGYRAVHVAAQYGQTTFLNHIIAMYGAVLDAPDNDGRSPLHWAAYKGFTDTVRLLLFRDAYQGGQDKEDNQACPFKALSFLQDCVEQFDHHCPWISNCVGKKIKWDFFVFLCMGTFTLFLGAVITVNRLWTGLPVPLSSEIWFRCMVVEHPGAITFVVMDVIILSGAFALTVAQASQIARNITINELANAARYSYLCGPEGHFGNSYNHGCWKNFTDFLVYGYTNDDEIAWPLLEQAAG